MTKEQIRQLRKTLNLTQEQLGDKIGYSNLHISQVELGNRKVGIKLLRAIEEKLPFIEGVIPKDKPKTPGDKFNENNIGF